MNPAAVAIWEIEKEMRELVHEPNVFVARARARTILRQLTRAGFVRAGDTLDSILDHYSLVMGREVPG